MKNILLFSFLLALVLPALSQPDFPSNMPVFDSSTVARVDITVNPDTLAWIYENVESDIEFHASFRFNNGTIDETVENIGFRLRGNTSRYSQKKSFKVSFNTFEPGRKFYGMEKINLNGEHNDPSIIRSRICWHWLRRFNVPAPRATHAEVYINGNYYGLYIIVEHVDEEFAESRFDNKDGNLYMCLWPADLDYLGSNPDLYKLTSNGRQVYELKTNTGPNDYSDLAHFIDILNNTPLENLECEIDKVFNLNDYLKIMALDIITGNWDGYIYNKNNYYLYQNTETGRFEYIPYDLDNTLGIDWLDRDWGTRDIYDWEQHGTEARPLYQRLLDVPEIRDRYSYYLSQFLEILADEDSLFASIDQVRNMIGPSVLDDPYYPLDYGYNYGDFLNSYGQALGDHVDYGLKPYIQTRTSTAGQQLIVNNIAPAVNHIKASKAIPGNDYWVRAFVEDDDPGVIVKLQYQVDGGAVQWAAMADDGLHHDREAGDGFFGYILPPFQFNQTLSWQIVATDINSHASMHPCLPVVISFHPSTDPQLFINELMADNDSTIADEYGEYDNWLEIYNGDDEPVWIGDKYLSDNLLNPDKWQLPDLTMQPGSFIIIWCDNQPGQGPFHTDFKLNDEGEQAGIFDNETTNFFLIDSVTWGMVPIDISFGRESDGGLPWIYFNQPTPGYGNQSFGIKEEIPSAANFRFYPNPVTGNTIFFKENFSGMITDISGHIIWRGQDVKRIDAGPIRPGMYLIMDNEGNTAKLIRL